MAAPQVVNPQIALENALRTVPVQNGTRFRRDVLEAVTQNPMLQIVTAPLTLLDGRQERMVALDGLVPTYYQQQTYHTPVILYLPPSYPHAAPIVQLKPAPPLYLVPGHPHVDASGFVRLPALSEWQAGSSSIAFLLGTLSSVFTDRPPLQSVKPSTRAAAAMRPGGGSIGGGAVVAPIPAQPGGGPGPGYGYGYGGYGGPGSGAGGGSGASGGSGGMVPTPSPMYAPSPAAAPAPAPAAASGYGYGYGAGPAAAAAPAAASVPGGATGSGSGGQPSGSSYHPPFGRQQSDSDIKTAVIQALNPQLTKQLAAEFERIRSEMDTYAEQGELLEGRHRAMQTARAALAERLAAVEAANADMRAKIEAAEAWLARYEGGLGLGSAAAAASSSKIAEIAEAEDGTGSVYSTDRAGAGGGGGAGGGRAGGSTGTRSAYRGSGGGAGGNLKGGGSGGGSGGGGGVEELVVPATRAMAQLLESVVEDAALEDYHAALDEAVTAQCVDVDSMLREVREGARKQFRARYLAKKASAVLSAAAGPAVQMQVAYPRV